MSHAATPTMQTLAFQVDLPIVETGASLSMFEEFATYSGLAMKDLLEVVIPARTVIERNRRP